MIEALQQIPGPTFLLYFAILSVVCIVVGRLLIESDGSTLYILPRLTQFDPLTMAMLRGGVNAVIQTALFSLQNKGLIKVEGSGKTARVQCVESNEKPSGGVEQKIYSDKTSRKPRDIFKEEGLRSHIEKYFVPIQKDLERKRLIRDEEGLKGVWRIAITMFLVVSSVGGTKLYLGWVNDRPIFFLVVLLLVVLYFIFSKLTPKKPDLTSLGKRYFQEVEKHFEWLKDEVGSNRTPEGIDPAMAVAIFGIAILADSELYGSYATAFQSSGGAGGCGGCSGCSGCSSGGAGCSSGCSSGCGGGCGGCG